MSELERWEKDSELPWQVRQELQRVDGRELLERRYFEARAGMSKYKAQTAIRDIFDMADHAFERAGEFDRVIDERARRNSALEFLGRQMLEETCAKAARVATRYEREVMGRE